MGGGGLLLAVEDIFLRFLHLGVTRSHCAEVGGADDRGAVADAEAAEATETAVPRPLQVPRPVP